MKRNASNTYSLNGLVQMESWTEPVTERLLKNLEARARQPTDMSDLLKDYAMDAVFAVTFGRDFNYIEQGDVLKMCGLLETVSDYMAILMSGEDGGDKEIFDLATSEIEAAKRNPSEDGPLTMLQRLLLNQAKDPSSINSREIMTHTLRNISAGSDTTAVALRSVLYLQEVRQSASSILARVFKSVSTRGYCIATPMSFQTQILFDLSGGYPL
ncbi:cytochrome P450 [Ilyonectria destructans]|nr:cytochrome P450 [Ilyonectria destructans]